MLLLYIVFCVPASVKPINTYDNILKPACAIVPVFADGSICRCTAIEVGEKPDYN